MVIELIPANESGEAAATRAARTRWLVERDYRVIDVEAGDVERDVAGVLDRIAQVAAV
jgi:tRNA/rRNA methyltransferase